MAWSGKSSIKEMVGGVGSGLVALLLKGPPAADFISSRNWLALGRAVSPELARPQMSHRQKYRKEKAMMNTFRTIFI